MNVGPTFNINPAIGTFDNFTSQELTTNCLYSTFCYPCAVGSLLNTSIGMPWYFGCLCVNSFAAYNILRYQYNIEGNELLIDLIAPVGYLSGFQVLFGCIQGLIGIPVLKIVYQVIMPIPFMVSAFFGTLEVKAREKIGDVYLQKDGYRDEGAYLRKNSEQRPIYPDSGLDTSKSI